MKNLFYFKDYKLTKNIFVAEVTFKSVLGKVFGFKFV